MRDVCATADLFLPLSAPAQYFRCAPPKLGHSRRPADLSLASLDRRFPRDFLPYKLAVITTLAIECGTVMSVMAGVWMVCRSAVDSLRSRCQLLTFQRSFSTRSCVTSATSLRSVANLSRFIPLQKHFGDPAYAASRASLRPARPPPHAATDADSLRPCRPSPPEPWPISFYVSSTAVTAIICQTFLRVGAFSDFIADQEADVGVARGPPAPTVSTSSRPTGFTCPSSLCHRSPP